MIDFRILELLASKVCHDLISPVGAINNGVELIEDIGGSVVDDAMKLISTSATQSARRLRLFRMAYGRAGAESGVTLKDIRSCARDYLSTSKCSLVWSDEHIFTELAEHKGGLKVLLNVIMLAEETLSHGGTITVEPLVQGESNGVVINVTGTHTTLSENAITALEGGCSVEDVTPRTVHAYVLGLTAEQYGLRLTHQQISEEKLSLMLLPTVAAA